MMIECHQQMMNGVRDETIRATSCSAPRSDAETPGRPDSWMSCRPSLFMNVTT